MMKPIFVLILLCTELFSQSVLSTFNGINVVGSTNGNGNGNVYNFNGSAIGKSAGNVKINGLVTNHWIQIYWAPGDPTSCTPTCSSPTSFNVYRSTVSGGPYTLVGSTTATICPTPVTSTCNYADSTVSLSTTYYYVVTAYNSSSSPSESAYSTQTSGSVPGS